MMVINVHLRQGIEILVVDHLLKSFFDFGLVEQQFVGNAQAHRDGPDALILEEDSKVVHDPFGDG